MHEEYDPYAGVPEGARLPLIPRGAWWFVAGLLVSAAMCWIGGF